MKVIFKENLHQVYRETYNMVKKLRFTGEYVDKLSPVDRKLYIMYAEQDKEAKRARKQKPASNDGGMLSRNIPADIG